MTPSKYERSLSPVLSSQVPCDDPHFLRPEFKPRRPKQDFGIQNRKLLLSFLKDLPDEELRRLVNESGTSDFLISETNSTRCPN